MKICLCKIEFRKLITDFAFLSKIVQSIVYKKESIIKKKRFSESTEKLPILYDFRKTQSVEIKIFTHALLSDLLHI